jgi:hypothetical protein
MSNLAFNRSSATCRRQNANSTLDIASNTLPYVFTPLGLPPRYCLTGSRVLPRAARSDPTPRTLTISRSLKRHRGAVSRPLPTSASQTLYRTREAELGSPSNSAITVPSGSVILLISPNSACRSIGPVGSLELVAFPTGQADRQTESVRRRYPSRASGQTTSFHSFAGLNVTSAAILNSDSDGCWSKSSRLVMPQDGLGRRPAKPE